MDILPRAVQNGLYIEAGSPSGAIMHVFVGRGILRTYKCWELFQIVHCMDYVWVELVANNACIECGLFIGIWTESVCSVLALIYYRKDRY